MGKNDEKYELEKIYLEDEIDLIDIFKTLYKNKWLILFITILITVSGIIVAFKVPLRYRVTAKVRLNEIEKYGFTSNLTFYQNNKFFINKLSKNFRERNEKINNNTVGIKELNKKLVYNIKLDEEIEKGRKDPKVLWYTIKIESNTAEKTYDYMQSYLKDINNFIYNQVREKLEKNLKETKKEVDTYFNDMKENILKLKSKNNTTIKFGNEVYSIELSNLKSSTALYEEQLSYYKKLLQQENFLKTNKLVNIIDIDDIPKYPIKPNKKLRVLISFVLGLFLGIFIAFVKEFFKDFNFSQIKD